MLKILTSIFLFTSIIWGVGFSPKNGYVDSQKELKNKGIQITYPNEEGYKCDKILYPRSENYGVDFRLKKVDLQKGLFEYYVYQNGEIVANNIFWQSQACEKKYNSLSDSDKKELEKQFSQVNFAKEDEIEKVANSSLDSLESKYFDRNYKSTTSQIYLPTSKYLVAVLTLDKQIINIKSSIQNGKIILNNGYTIGDNELSKKLNLNFFSFIFEWITKSNIIFRELQMFLLSFFVPFTLALFGLGAITKKMQDLRDNENLLQRGIVAVGIFVTFVISPVSFKNYEKNIQYTQSSFQMAISDIAKSAVDYADRLSNTLAGAYVNHLKSDLGVASKKEIKRVLAQNIKLRKLSNEYLKFQDGCYKNRTNSNYDGFQADSITTFPSSELYQNSAEKGLKLNEKTEFKKWNDKDIRYTLSYCRNIDLVLNATNNQIKQNNAFLEKVNDTKDNKIIDDFTKSAKEMYQNSAQMGFLYAPFIAFNRVFIENYGISQNRKNDSFVGQSDSELGINRLAYLTPWSSAPGAETTIQIFNKFSPAMRIKNAIDTSLKSIPFLGGALSATGKMIIDTTNYLFSIKIIEDIYSYLPLLAIALASILSIAFFGITLFIYFLISPFFAIWIFATQQEQSVIAFLSRGLAIIFKPVMIVISIVIAIIAINLINELGFAITDKVFTFFNQNNINFDSNIISHTETNIIVSFMHGLGDMLLSFATAIFSFFLIFKGSDIILSVFGFKDMGVDAKNMVDDVQRHVAKQA